MIFHDIYQAGSRIEWDYVADFGRETGTERGVVSGYDVQNFCMTEEDGSYTMSVTPLYVVHTDSGLTKYVAMEDPNIRNLED